MTLCVIERRFEMRMILVMTMLVCGGLGCTDTSVNTDPSALGEVIFESEYVNFAWGVSWRGQFIAESGTVHSFDRTSDTVQWSEDHTGMFTRLELERKFSRRDTLRSIVAADTLRIMRQLSRTIDAASYSDTLTTGADMGLWRTSIYILKQENGMYQRIVLNCGGDWTYSNTSPNAAMISNWLKQLR